MLYHVMPVLFGGCVGLGSSDQGDLIPTWALLARENGLFMMVLSLNNIACKKIVIQIIFDLPFDWKSGHDESTQGSDDMPVADYRLDYSY